MRKTFYLLMITAAFICFGENAQAQLLLPASSPKAKVTQTVGLTDITIDYSSPGVKGREGKIWGGLVPYGEVWRMGANQSTKVTFDRDVKINGKELKAGTYSLGAIPGQNEWTVIFANKEELGGWGEYNSATDDALRVQVKPIKTATTTERLDFDVIDFDNEKATIVMDWENLRIPIPVTLDTKNQTAKSIENTFNPSWGTYNSAARYLMETGDPADLNRALTYADASIKAQNHWFNNWTRAQILAKLGRPQDAYQAALKAQELGNQPGQNFFFKDQVDKAVVEWKNKKK